MGDRMQIKVVERGESVVLYSHWDGYRGPEILANALERGKARQDDAPYLTRIIFCEMIRDDIDGETGYGIWASDQDGYTITVDVGAQTVILDGDPISFADFVTKYAKAEK